MNEDSALLEEVDRALAVIAPLADQGWDEAISIARQLRWCRGRVAGDPVEPAPGPLSMGLIAVREFDMYGSDPDLAARINRIQDEIERRFPGEFGRSS